jgi:uncharacterized membrane protein
MSLRGVLLNRWDEVRNGYWFLPLVMSVGAVALSFATLELDRGLADRLGDAGWVYSGSAQGARSVLQTIATSMIGLAGVVFSITTVTLTLAAKQFGPRIFRNFMRDTGTQVVLGTFTGTFLYCLLILRQVHGSDEQIDRFVPQASMLTAVVLAVCGLGVLIYFIHHVAASIQTPNVVAAVARDLHSSVRDLDPEEVGGGPEGDDAALRGQVPERFGDEAVPVGAAAGGYVRRVEADALFGAAMEADVVVRVEARPGVFVAAGDPVLSVWPPGRAGDDLRDRLRGAVVLGDQRTPNQDVTFPVEQLVEVATLALSAGVNDLATAEMSIDRLGEGLAALAGRRIPSAYRADADGRLRVIAPPVDLPALLDAAIDPIRQNGRTQPTVMVRLLGALASVAARAVRPGDRAAVLSHAALVHEQASAVAASEHDRRLLAAAFETVRQRLPGAARE